MHVQSRFQTELFGLFGLGCAGSHLSLQIHDHSWCASLRCDVHSAYRGVEPQACTAAWALCARMWALLCSAPCVPLQTPGRCIDAAPLGVPKPHFPPWSEARMRGDRCVSNCWCREAFTHRQAPEKTNEKRTRCSAQWHRDGVWECSTMYLICSFPQNYNLKKVRRCQHSGFYLFISHAQMRSN